MGVQGASHKIKKSQNIYMILINIVYTLFNIDTMLKDGQLDFCAGVSGGGLKLIESNHTTPYPHK